ncbi:MAG: universal stress protein [Nitrospiraceae bacterium]|nr:MAG: universal stress protein [Nitrospiraceae bacterium]
MNRNFKTEAKVKGYRKILIAVNGSTDALTQGLQLARDEKCWVTVVKVIPPQDGDLDLTGIRNIEDAFNSGAGREIKDIGEIAKQERMMVKTRLEEGKVCEKIVEVAEDERCDLIIMGSERKNWFRRIFGENIIERVIEQAPCPVLVVGA